LAKLWVDGGHEVRVASRHPEQLRELVERLGKLASAGTPTDAAEFGDVVMLTVPLKAVPDLATDLRSSLSRKVVAETLLDIVSKKTPRLRYLISPGPKISRSLNRTFTTWWVSLRKLPPWGEGRSSPALRRT
jgi:predicted dinucleotide-binding enzyme